MAILSNGKFYGFLCSAKETGQKLANGAKEYVENFVSGFAGHGWKLWEYVKGKWMLEIDAIRVRGQFTVFEMLVSKVRAIIGAQAITQGCGKIKDVRLSEDGSAYLITLEDKDMSFMEHDFILCQEFTGSNRKYHVEIESVVNGVIRIPLSEFEMDEDGSVVNPPMAGDDIVQFGNSSHEEKYIGRHSAIYIHADESGQPAIDVLDDIYSKNWSDCIKVRMGGDLPGTKDSKGFYCVNGKLLFVDDEGSTVSVINPDGSASFARGKLSWNKDGSPSFSGTILVKTDANNIWTVNEQCENIIGNPSGKRIIISPNTQDIRFFDSNNKNVISIESSKKQDINALFNSSSTDINIMNIPFSVSKGIKETYISNIFETKGVGSLVSNFSGGSYSQKKTTSSVVITIIDYEDASGKVVIGRTSIYGKSQMDNNDWVINETNIFAPVKEGFHRIQLTLFCNEGLISINDFSCRFVSNTYLSSYFSNGLALGTSNENSFVVLNNENDSLEGLFVNRNAGLKLNEKSLLIKQGGYYGLTPCIISYGQVFVGPSSAIIDKAKSIDMFIPTVERIGIGLVKMSFPKHWNVTSSSVYFTLTGIGQSVGASSYEGMIKATLSHWINNRDGSQSAVIALSDDATNNDGTFFFEIKRY